MKFDKKFKTLGLEVDLHDSLNHRAYIGHTESRVSELSALLEDILQASRISAKHAESLRGRMLWFETYAFGRVGNAAVKKLGDLAYLGVKAIRFGLHTFSERQSAGGTSCLHQLQIS